MKKILPFLYVILLITAAGLVLPSFAAKTAHEPKIKVVSENRDVTDFTKISVAGSMDVFVKQGAKAVSVSGDTEILSKVKTEVKNGELRIYFDKSINKMDNFYEKKQVEVHLSVPNLYALSLAGSGDVLGESDFSSEKEFDVSVAGSGNIQFSITTNTLNADIAGSGDILLAGKANDADIHIAGSGDFASEKFAAENASVSISGSGDAIMEVSKTLEASISGSGDVIYSGNATVSSSSSGSGDVIKR